MCVLIIPCLLLRALDFFLSVAIKPPQNPYNTLGKLEEGNRGYV